MDKKGSIGLWAAISIGVGGMIGAGIFSILGLACQIAGNAVYISFILAGIVALLSTYSYAKLGGKYPSAGGPVEFLVRGFGAGILSGGFNILLWVGYVFALALYAKAFGGYARTFLPSSASQIWINIFAAAIILIFMAVNVVGSKAVGRSEFLIVAIKMVILIVFGVVGISFIKPSLLSISQRPHVSNIFFAAGIVFLGFEGFGLITNAAEDMRSPKKTLPRALYMSVVIVIGIYVLVSLVVIGNLSAPAITNAKEYALAEAAKPFLGLIGFKVMAIAALFSTASAINATLYGGSNVSYMIAKRGELPEIFERKTWAGSTEGLFITAGLVLVFTILFDLGGIAMLGSASFLLIYAAVNVAHLRLREETGANVYVIWASIIGCLSAFGILVYYELNRSPLTLIALAIALTLSFFIEWIYRKYSQRTLKVRSQRR